MLLLQYTLTLYNVDTSLFRPTDTCSIPKYTNTMQTNLKSSGHHSVEEKKHSATNIPVSKQAITASYLFHPLFSRKMERHNMARLADSRVEDTL